MDISLGCEAEDGIDIDALIAQLQEVRAAHPETKVLVKYTELGMWCEVAATRCGLRVVEVEKGWNGAVLEVRFESPDGRAYTVGDRDLVRDWRGAVVQDPQTELGPGLMSELHMIAYQQGLRNA